MITAFEELCITVYVIVDDLYRELRGPRRRSGPAAECSDSELLTIILVSECKGWEKESEWYDLWQAHFDLFTAFPERSRINRRRRALREVLNQIRFRLVQQAERHLDSRCILDSYPIEVVRFKRVPQARGDWWQAGARFGQNPTMARHFFGFKLYALVTVSGFLVDFMLAPANVDEREAADELLAIYTDLLILADKGFVSQPWADQLWRQARIVLLTEGRANQKQRLPKAWRRWLHSHRQQIETVFAQFSNQFHLHQTCALSFGGFAARLIAKLTAHTLSCFVRLTQGAPDWLRIKSFAFPCAS